jgi:Peptidase C26
MSSQIDFWHLNTADKRIQAIYAEKGDENRSNVCTLATARCAPIEEVGLTAIPLVAVTFDVNELEEFVLWREMFRGFVAVGIAPIAVHTDAEGVPAEALMQRVDGLIISGGSDVGPARCGGDVDDPLIDASKPDVTTMSCGCSPRRGSTASRCWRSAAESSC